MSEKKPKKKKTAGDVILTVILIAAICVFAMPAIICFIFIQSTKREQMSTII